jgi:hypothetical protein
MAGARGFLLGGVFHIKSVCLSVFDMFLSSYFANSVSGHVAL